MCWSQKKYSRSWLKREGGIRLLKGRLDDDKMTSDRPLTPDLTQRESQPCDFSEFLPSCPGGAGTALGGLDGKGGSSAVTEKRPVSQPHDSRHSGCPGLRPGETPPLPGEDPPQGPYTHPKPQWRFPGKCPASPSSVLPRSLAQLSPLASHAHTTHHCKGTGLRGLPLSSRKGRDTPV